MTYTAGWGLRGSLAKSKTTGPGKKIRHREIFVSSEAYVKRQDWLDVGLRLWDAAPRPRQNFIALPDPSMEAFRQMGAEVQGLVALTRHVLEKINLTGLAETEPELNRRAAKFWTEHSSRPTLPSWARALGVPKDVTNRLGYWSVGAEASELYIRTYKLLVAKVQSTVATFIREALQAQSTEGAFPDLFGEKAFAEELRKFLGTELDASSGQPWAAGSTTTKLRYQLKYSWAETEAKEPALPDSEEGRQKASISSSEEKSVEAHAPVPNTTAWVVTRLKSKKPGCLHVIGRCYRVPGVHYKDWVEVAENASSGSFERACRQCFPLGHLVIRDAHLEQISSKTEEGIAKAGEEELSSSLS